MNGFHTYRYLHKSGRWTSKPRRNWQTTAEWTLVILCVAGIVALLFR